MAKPIKFNLNLNGKTVSNLDELQEHFSAEILPIYRSGRLLKWLQARELTEQVQALQAITPSEDDIEQLGAICRVLDLDDDTEVLKFLVKDWQAAQQVSIKQSNIPPDLFGDDKNSTKNIYFEAEILNHSNQDSNQSNEELDELINGLDQLNPKEKKSKHLSDFMQEFKSELNDESKVFYLDGLCQYKSKKQLNNALNSFAVDAIDNPVLLIDFTLMKSGKDGLLLTNTELFIKPNFREKFSVKLSNINEFYVDADERELVINSERFSYTHSELNRIMKVTSVCINNFLNQE